MKQRKIDDMFKYLKVAGLGAAILIVTAASLKAQFYEPADFHLDVESVEREVREPENDRFPDIEHGGWV